MQLRAILNLLRDQEDLFSPISLVQFCIIFREKDYFSSYPFIDIMAEFTQASDNR